MKARAKGLAEVQQRGDRRSRCHQTGFFFDRLGRMIRLEEVASRS